MKYLQETLKDAKNMKRILDKMCILRTKFITVQEKLELRFNQALIGLARDVEMSGPHDSTEAYTLVILAFNHYGLLPTEPGE